MEETKCERERQTTATVKVRRDATTNDERRTRDAVDEIRLVSISSRFSRSRRRPRVGGSVNAKGNSAALVSTDNERMDECAAAASRRARGGF